jgi:hypothetical protein
MSRTASARLVRGLFRTGLHLSTHIFVGGGGSILDVYPGLDVRASLNHCGSSST